MTYHIEDWASSRELFDGRRFETFEDARDFISEYADAESWKDFPRPEDEDKREEMYDGICEDLYAIEDKQ